MPFRFKRVNMSTLSKNDYQVVDNCLSQNYARKGNFQKIRETYLDDRKCEQHELYLTDPEAREIREKGFEDTAWDLFLNFTIGVKETSFYLASSYINGYGVNRDEFLSNLTLAVGIKLGDERSIKLLEGEPPLPSNTQQFADKCIAQIKKHEAGVKNRDVSCEEIMARAKAFDYFISKNSGHSYCETIHTKNDIGMKSFAYYVEPIEDSMSANNNAVKPMGQEGAKEHCEIS
ncbi:MULTISPECIES: hypothetical protein [unclassified Rickettsia]|uniref:hypothetical protein n=1 Tax=unclassified Rickettsia TaxID=114295 RepID=UPI0031333F5E